MGTARNRPLVGSYWRQFGCNFRMRNGTDGRALFGWRRTDVSPIHIILIQLHFFLRRSLTARVVHRHDLSDGVRAFCFSTTTTIPRSNVTTVCAPGLLGSRTASQRARSWHRLCGLGPLRTSRRLAPRSRSRGTGPGGTGCRPALRSSTTTAASVLPRLGWLHGTPGRGILRCQEDGLARRRRSRMERPTPALVRLSRRAAVRPDPQVLGSHRGALTREGAPHDQWTDRGNAQGSEKQLRTN